MKLLLIPLSLLVLRLPVSAAGKKNPAKPRGPAPKATTDPYAIFDINKNGRLDMNERENMRTAFKSGNKTLAQYDLNHDGNIDDNEIAMIKSPLKK